MLMCRVHMSQQRTIQMRKQVRVMENRLDKVSAVSVCQHSGVLACVQCPDTYKSYIFDNDSHFCPLSTYSHIPHIAWQVVHLTSMLWPGLLL